MKKSKVAIILPFTSLNTYVFECMDACFGQNYSDFILVLLPNKPVKLPSKYRSKIKIVPTGDVTIAKKRNMGIQKFSEVDFFAFIDSDAYPHPNWLKNAIKDFSISKKILAVGGPNVSPEIESIYEKAVGNSLKSFLVSGAGAFRKKITGNKSYINLHLPTCNLIVKNSSDFLVRFDEKLLTGEDIELCSRIISQGWKILYHDNIIVYHHNRPLFRPFILQRITYGFSLFKVLRKKICLASLLPSIPLFFLVFLIFAFLVSIVSPVAKILWLVIIPIYLCLLLIEAIRHSSKIYEIPLTFIAILTGNLAPAVGSTLELLGVDLDIKKMYRNYYEKRN